MSRSKDSGIDQILAALNSGAIDHETATDRLFSLFYDELRQLAFQLMQAERAGHSLQATALVHEAYLHLVRGQTPTWQDRAHLFGVAARAMRQILVDHARGKLAEKRGGGWERITLDEEVGVGEEPEVKILDLDEALKGLAGQDERTARVAELRIFGGLRIKEVAHVLGVSRRTVQGDWRVAKMWLNRELTPGPAA